MPKVAAIYRIKGGSCGRSQDFTFMLVKQIVSGIDLYTYLRKLVSHIFPQVYQ